jgi:uncharacterized protein YegP (UPF0339 family)
MSRSTAFEARARRPSAAPTVPRGAARSTVLFTRHMLGVIELERDERRRRRAAIRNGTERYEPVAGVVEPRIVAVLAAAARAPALAALDVDRWVDEGGSFDAGRYSDEGDEAMQFVIYQDNGGRFHWRLVGDDGGRLAISAEDFGTADEARRAAAAVHEHAGAAAGIGG